MNIIYVDSGIGWQPITHMVELAAELLSAKLFKIPDYQTSATPISKLFRLQSRKQHGESCLIITPTPTGLGALYEIDGWRNAFGNVAAWVIDSFWIDRIPWYARYLNHIDHYFVTNPEEIDLWRRITGTPTSCVPWGSDVLRLGSESIERHIDLIRVGRQPVEWEDDISNETFCNEIGLSYHGRPPMHANAYDNQVELMNLFSKSKFSLCFSNLVNPTIYTHKKMQYLTGRWVDALASGCTVAGVHPKCEIVKELIWDGALIELSTTDRCKGLIEIKEACQLWKRENVVRNYQYSLSRLDWRWRFMEISKVMDLKSPLLELEMEKINSKIQQPL